MCVFSLYKKKGVSGRGGQRSSAEARGWRKEGLELKLLQPEPELESKLVEKETLESKPKEPEHLPPDP